MTLLEISEKTEDVDMSLDERVLKRKAIKDGKRVIKKSSSVTNQKIVGGKSVTYTKAEKIKRERGQKRGKIKRRAKSKLASMKRKRSLKKRTF